VAPLPNPVNDGAVIAAAFKEAGFDVVDSRHDLPAVKRAARAATLTARATPISPWSITPARHGVDGTNYLIPVDAKLE
jgi:uncharacterized caspase-like protein